MSNCDPIRELLVLHAEGVLAPDERERIERHIAGCVACGREAEEIRRIRGYLSDPGLFNPETDLAWQLLPEKLAGRARLLLNQRRWYAGFGMPKWAAVTMAMTLLAIVLVWALRYQTPAPLTEAPAPIAAGNEAFLERVRSAYAREATAQYLAKCHALLVDVVSAGKNCAGEGYDVALEAERARRLLQEKRILDTELMAPDVEHARPLCDDLENFLINLSMSQECESSDTVRGMENFIESKHLLLRIDLVQPGIF
jgi:hypothetical protein